MEFICKRCNYKTSIKTNLKRHLIASNICKPTYEDIDRNSLILELYPTKDCKYECDCGKKYSHASTLSTHKKTCNYKPKDSNYVDTQEAVIMLIEKNKLLEEEIEKLKKIPTTSIVNNFDNKVINNIVINDFGKENIDYISEAFVRRCLRQQDMGVIKLTEKIHFNDDHPENKNLAIPNKKEPYVQVVEKGKPILKPKKEVIDDLIVNIGNILDEQLEFVIEELKKNWVKNERMTRELDRFMKELFDDESSVRKRLRERVYLLLINNR